MTILLLSFGFIFLIAGAEALVRGASRMAADLGVSPLVIGLTVVAFGTSSPELAVSIKSALSGQNGIALGNVIGSNIFNILFILGLSALIIPLTVNQQLIRFDVPLMVLLSVIVLLLSLDHNFGHFDGSILLIGLAFYIIILIYKSRKESTVVIEEYENRYSLEMSIRHVWIKNAGLIIGGLIMLIFGSRWLVDGAVSFARYLGVSELVVGLTIVAAGTSLPEVVTSVIAAVHRERDIAVGNVVGSNIFNMMGVLGFAGVVAPTGIEVSVAVIGFDLPVMIAVSLICLPIFFTGGVISRLEGALMLGYYVAYTVYLILAATQHDALPVFNTVVLYFIIPLTVIMFILVTLKEIRRRKYGLSK